MLFHPKARPAILHIMCSGAARSMAALGSVCAVLGALADEPNAPLLPPETVQFQQSAPYSTGTEFARRLGFAGMLLPYDVGQERFRLVVPGSYTTNQSWGLIVWISPGNDPRVPAAWESEFGRRKLLMVAAYGSGNERTPIDRIRLALDATCNVCRRYNLDYRRLYVGGFSGGARIASILGVAYADLFSGALCICGVDFYQNVPSAAGGYYPSTYKPASETLIRAKTNGRFVLVTGENDQNRDNTQSTAENGFRANQFGNCLYFEVPGMGHAMPAVKVLSHALNYLDRNAVLPN
jgi:predicted esterase